MTDHQLLQIIAPLLFWIALAVTAIWAKVDFLTFLSVVIAVGLMVHWGWL